MRRSQLCLVVAVTGVLLWVGSPAQGSEAPERQDYFIAGLELGGTGPLSPLDRYTKDGMIGAPFAGYMFNRFLGVMGQIHLAAMPNRDACKPVGHPDYSFDGCYKNKPLEAEWTWTLGGTIGPRLALPLGGFEVWGTFQGGGFTGLSDDSPISDTSLAFSTGGGVNVAMRGGLSFGGFARYNRLYQEAHGRGDVRYAAGGISLTYKFAAPTGAPPSK